MKSEWVDVASGVSQGSVLGQILFLIFINDVDEVIMNRIWKFADDAKLLGRCRSALDVKSIEEDLVALAEWCENWQMDFNVR